jgi:hypothetical protein
MRFYLAAIGILLLVGGVVAGVIITDNSRDFEDRNHLTAIGLSLQTCDKLPDNIYKGDKALLSWRVALLKDWDKDLCKQFHLDEPWNSPHNLEVAKHVPECYRDSRGSKFTPYLAVVGDKAAFHPHSPQPWSAAKLVRVVTVARSDVIWTEPRDISVVDAQKDKNLRWAFSQFLSPIKFHTDYLNGFILDTWGNGAKPQFEEP